MTWLDLTRALAIRELARTLSACRESDRHRLGVTTVVADYTAKESRFTGKINWAQVTSVLTTTTTSSTARNGCVSPWPGSSQRGLAAAPWLPGLPVVLVPARTK
jgi:hypothetical protein